VVVWVCGVVVSVCGGVGWDVVVWVPVVVVWVRVVVGWDVTAVVACEVVSFPSVEREKIVIKLICQLHKTCLLIFYRIVRGRPMYTY
jgi:hypothetical protein